MKEKGVDISRNKPKKIDNKMVQESDKIVVMGCSAQGFCLVPLLGKVVDWKIEDPKGKSIEEVRKIRDEIEKKIVELVKES
jgi:arsenate reductase